MFKFHRQREQLFITVFTIITISYQLRYKYNCLLDLCLHNIEISQKTVNLQLSVESGKISGTTPKVPETFTNGKL